VDGEPLSQLGQICGVCWPLGLGYSAHFHEIGAQTL
jgi:hypothetical protein